MRTISASKLDIRVDDEDYDSLSQHKWWCSKNGYAYRQEEGRTVYMHRDIMQAKKGLQVDHINHDGKDNQKKNLRICSSSQNNANRVNREGSTSKFKGVYYRKDTKKWRAEIQYKGKRSNLGSFKTENEAAIVYDKAATGIFGAFALLNNPGAM